MGLNGVERINGQVQLTKPALVVENGKMMSVPLGGKTVTVETNNDVSEMENVGYNPYKLKDYEKNKTKEIENLFIMSGKDEKEAKKLAKAYVKNEKEKYEFYMTKTFDNKEEFKKAQKEEKEKYKQTYDSLRKENKSRSEAKDIAESLTVQNKLLKNKKALKILENNKEVFYDENGNLSQEKIKKFVKGLMNPATNDLEVDNYHMSLKEARLMGQVLGCDDKTLRKIVKSTGGNYEKDYSTLINIASAGIFAALGGAAGAPFDIVSESLSTSAASSAGAVAGAEAGAKATVNAAAVTAPIGGVLGALLAGKDPGGVEDRVYEPKLNEHPAITDPTQDEPEEVPPADVPPVQEEVPQEKVPEEEVLQEEPPAEPEKEPCKVIVQNGESLAKLSKKYGVSIDEIKRLNADKLKRFHNSYNCDDKKAYEGFLVGTEILIPDGCDKAEGNKDRIQAQKDYEKSVLRDKDKFCNERFRGQITSQAFRKQHKIGEFVEEK